jgi:glycerol-3-phosphate cytidylyltransferase
MYILRVLVYESSYFSNEYLMSRQLHTGLFTSVQSILEHIVPLRKQGKTLVTTNGCFDILHAGHVRYLTDAAALGDILVVGVNCDAVVQKLKGQGRPVQGELDRACIISSLRMVECAFIFYENDPRAFLELLKPDIHVKGGDYTADIIEKPVVEANGGRVVIVPFKEGRSTSGIIRRIRSDSL